MFKYLILALAIGVVSLKAEAQSENRTQISSLVLSDKLPPKHWFGTPAEREMAAALLRVAKQLDGIKDSRRRLYPKYQVAYSLARLGYEEEARSFDKSASFQKEITKYVAICAILAGREKEAVALLPKLDDFERVKIQELLGNAALAWQNDRVNARRWFGETRNYYMNMSQPIGGNSILMLEVASNLAKAGDRDGARAIFKSLDEAWKGPNFEAWYFIVCRSALFNAQYQSGFEEEALATLGNDKMVVSSAIQTLFRLNKEAKAIEILNRETPFDAFNILYGPYKSPRIERPSREQFVAMRKFWSQLSSAEKKNASTAGDMAVFVAHFESIQAAYAFIASNFKGYVATEAARELKEAILKDGELQKKADPKTLQKWREEALRDEEAKMKQSLTEPRGFFGATEDANNWMRLYEAAIAANDFKKARFALDKSEIADAQNKEISSRPLSNALMRYDAWRKLGDKKRVQQSLIAVKREAAQFNEMSEGAADFYGHLIFSHPELMQEIFLTKPPRDLMVISTFVERSKSSNDKSLIPAWILKIPDVPTRALAISSRANLLWPLDKVEIRPN